LATGYWKVHGAKKASGMAPPKPAPKGEASSPKVRPPLHPAWYVVAFVVAAFVAGLVIKWYRTGVLYP
jgi:hypothetical protein